MVYRGRVRDGVVVLDGPVPLPEGVEVRIEVLPAATETPDQEIPTLYERLKGLDGIAEGLPPDASANIDHYLYDAPKRS